MKKIIQARKSSQPTGVKTGGSTFKMNAPSNQSSGYGVSTITLYEVAA